jgi:hypothetical protein
VRSTPELLIPLLLIAIVGTLAWEFQVSLPLMANQVFHGGAATYGVMASVMGGPPAPELTGTGAAPPSSPARS